jgi:hypothetical protein
MIFPPLFKISGPARVDPGRCGRVGMSRNSPSGTVRAVMHSKPPMSLPSPLARTLFLLALFVISSVGWMAALDPTHRISPYGHTAWRIQDGYFAGYISSIAQTTDGYLWVGTTGGFDLQRCNPIRALAVCKPWPPQLTAPCGLG